LKQSLSRAVYSGSTTSSWSKLGSKKMVHN
jgi:hypothetical protein